MSKDAERSEEMTQALSENLAHVALEGASLLLLPQELISLLLTFLDPVCRLHLSQTNKALRSAIPITHDDRVAVLLYLETDLEHREWYFTCVGCMKLRTVSAFLDDDTERIPMRKPAREWPAANPAREPDDLRLRWARRKRISTAAGDTTLALWAQQYRPRRQAYARLLFGRHKSFSYVERSRNTWVPPSPPALTPNEERTLLQWVTGCLRHRRLCTDCHCHPLGFTPVSASAKFTRRECRGWNYFFASAFARAHPGSPEPDWPCRFLAWEKFDFAREETGYYRSRHAPRGRPVCTACAIWLDEHLESEPVKRWIRWGDIWGRTQVMRWKCTHQPDRQRLYTWDIDVATFDKEIGRDRMYEDQDT